ncbi:synaptotagmin-5-like [Clytia hemisphaerica]|uniref:C2 domain-containing protein n=1 Tax=Clytia hemisphaerica TaxID=252671 RepID=A0A7M5UEJ5_9CNID
MIALDQSTSSNAHHHNNAIVQILISIGGAICFLTLIALFISNVFNAITGCCKNLFGGSKKKEHPLRGNNDLNDNSFLRNSGKNKQYEQLKPGMKIRPTSLSVESLDSYKNAMFEIPGMMVANVIQPIENSSGYSTASYAESVHSDTTEGSGRTTFTEEMVQPNEKELFPGPAGSAPKRRSGQVQKQVNFRKTWHSESFDQSSDFVETFNPELYETKVRRTQMAGSLGKLKFSLQYEDKTKRKLIMSLHELQDLQYVKGTENVVGLYITAMLIPERDYRFQSKQLSRNRNIQLDEVFTFHSRPHNRDFEARTIHLTVVYVERSSKEIIYGESRMPLLSHEIYSQVPTDLTIGIKPSPPSVEIGDAQIVLSYSSEQKKLNVMIKTVKISNQNMLDHLTGLHIKAHLVRLGGDRLGKKKSVSKTLTNTSSTLVEFTDHMTFELEQENYLLCTLKLHVHGKHKIMGKHLSLGKVRIGDSNRDEGGKVHWKTVISSEGIGWTMWHPIYNA